MKLEIIINFKGKSTTFIGELTSSYFIYSAELPIENYTESVEGEIEIYIDQHEMYHNTLSFKGINVF